jgi:predicted transcriptional regulator YdeE
MEPELITRPGFSILGLSFNINPRNADYNEIWNTVKSRKNEIIGYTTELGRYGCYYKQGENETVYYLAGYAVNNVDIIPDDFELLEINESLYAVFKVVDDKVGEMMNFIHKDWLPNSITYKMSSRPFIEYYPPSNDEARVSMEIHVPLQIK